MKARAANPNLDEAIVLLLGASNLTYTEGGVSEAVPAMVERELAARSPGTPWRCEARMLFFGSRMAELAARHVDTLKPAAVVVTLVSDAFARDVPIAALRRRWPRLYPLARRVAEWLKRAAGGNNVRGPRGLLFRGPRWLVERVVGAEPEVAVAEAIRSTEEALDALLRRENLLVICGFSLHELLAGGRREEAHRERIELFKAQIVDHCRRRHVLLYDRPAEMRRAGLWSGLAHDLDYADLATRRFEAHTIARLLLEGFAASQ